MNKPQHLDVTRWVLLADAGPVRAVKGPFVYPLTQIEVVPAEGHRSRGQVCPDALGAGLAILSEKGDG